MAKVVTWLLLPTKRSTTMSTKSMHQSGWEGRMKAQKDRGDGLIAVLGGSSSGMLIFLALVVDNPIMAFLLPQKIAFSCDIRKRTSYVEPRWHQNWGRNGPTHFFTNAKQKFVKICFFLEIGLYPKIFNLKFFWGEYLQNRYALTIQNMYDRFSDQPFKWVAQMGKSESGQIVF